jgi:hypothetical protein
MKNSIGIEPLPITSFRVIGVDTELSCVCQMCPSFWIIQKVWWRYLFTESEKW